MHRLPNGRADQPRVKEALVSDRHVIVVGGGVIGTACAYYLARSDWRVTVIDQSQHGSQCSHGNCGLLSPSHVLPLAMPGAIRKNVKLMLQKNSPFYVKPRVDPALWRWLIKFAGRCRHEPMVQAGHARHAILHSSRSLFDELIAGENLDAEFEANGCLFVYKSQAALDEFDAENELTRDQYGISATKLDARQLSEMEPALKPGLAGAWYYSIDAHLRPDRLMKSWRATLERLNVRIIENCEVRTFSWASGTVKALQTSVGEQTADQFVVATGALTPLLTKQLRCELPIQPGKGYSLTMPRPEPCPSYPMLCPEHKVAITPMQTGFRLGSTMEFAGYDSSLNAKRLNALKESAAHYLLEPTAEPVQEQWYGWRPMTYDGLPIIDRCPHTDNVYIAAGHNMLGLSMAPATGKLIAEILNNQPTHIDREPYRVNRFD